MDQAQGLRNIMNKKQTGNSSRVITVTSGKGGVGKTNFTVNLAIWLRKQGKRVVIIDADFGLANIEVLFNIWPKFSFADVIRGHKGIPEVLTEGPFGISFISGGSGFRDLANITDRELSFVIDGFEYLDDIFDIILIDTGAGISKTVTTFVKASNEAVVITTPEPTSISDSYTLIKNVYESKEKSPDIEIVLNKVDDDKEGRAVYERLKGVCEKFLKMTPKFLGCISYDQDLVRAVKEQKPVIISKPTSVYSRSIAVLGRRILYRDTGAPQVAERAGILGFMKRIVSKR